MKAPGHHQRGFSLLEAIVALTILAGASLAMFAWLGGSLSQLNRAELYLEADPALRSAVDYLKLQDLAENPEGEFHSGSTRVRWQASPIEQNINGTAGSNFILSLYRVTLHIQNQDRQLPPLVTRIVNYRLRPGVLEMRNVF